MASALVSVAQGARAGLPVGPAGPRRLQAALPRGRGPGQTGRPPRTLRPMALGPAAPTHSFPAPFPGAARGGGDGGDKQAGARQRARAPRTRTWRADGEGRAGIHPGPAPEVTGTRGHCSAHGWLLVTPKALAGAGPPCGPPVLPQRTHPGTGARAPGRPGALASCTARAPAAAAAAARTVTLQTARQSASSRAPSPSPGDGSLCHMSLGTLPNTPTHAHTPTRPRTHRRGWAQTRTVAGTLTFTDTR